MSHFGDLWAFNVATATWRSMNAGSTDVARHSHTTHYDATRQRLILVMGVAGSGDVADVLEFGLG